MNAGGSLTGGGVKGQASVFTRKAELETLQSQLTRMAVINLSRRRSKIGDTKMEVAEIMQETEQFVNLTEKSAN